MNAVLSFSPLQLDQLSRDYWGDFDASAIAQLAGLADDPCYSIKFYKAPADSQEVIAPQGYQPYGLRITPGSIIFGFYLPAIPNAATPSASAPPAFTVQITDQSLQHEWWDDPISSLFVSNYKPCSAQTTRTLVGSFPNLLDAPYPVVGSGLFMVEIQSTSTTLTQRIELVLGVLEVCG